MPADPKRVSRRRFLASALGGAAFATVALGAGDEIVRGPAGVLGIYHAWQAASLPNRRYLDEQGAAFANVDLGFSFSPEFWTGRDGARAAPLRALRFSVEELGLTHPRIGIRWDQVARPNGSIDLGYYAPYLDYCYRRGLDLCLNVGPVRVFRWPEDHVPGFVLEKTGTPPYGARIEAGSPLSGAAREYLDRLIDALNTTYGAEKLNTTLVQPENEAFWRFGVHEWTLSREHLRAVFQQVNQRLPGARLLLTSAGRLNLRAVTNFYQELLADQRFDGRLVSGFDYHYKTPRLESYPLVRYLDPVVLALQFPPAPTCAENIEDARSTGFAIEVSEGEAEPTGDITSPGNSARDFRFMLLRCASQVLDPGQPSVLRIWGIEQLARRALRGQVTAEHEQIFDLIRSLTRDGGGLRA